MEVYKKDWLNIGDTIIFGNEILGRTVYIMIATAFLMLIVKLLSEFVWFYLPNVGEKESFPNFKKHFLFIVLFFVVSTPFSVLSFYNYFYISENGFNYSPFFSLKEENLSLDEIDKVEVSFVYRAKTRRGSEGADLHYIIFFKNGKSFDLGSEDKKDLIKLDQILVDKNVAKKYIQVDDRAFEFITKNRSEEFIKDIKTIFSSYDNEIF